MNSGSYSMTLPVLLSTLEISFIMRQEIWLVRQWITGVNPFLILPGCLKIIILARNLSVTLHGSLKESETTWPRLISIILRFFKLKATKSPGLASLWIVWYNSIDLTSVVRPVGPIVNFFPWLNEPVKTRPHATVPTPYILKTSEIGTQSGLPIERLGIQRA